MLSTEHATEVLSLAKADMPPSRSLLKHICVQYESLGDASSASDTCTTEQIVVSNAPSEEERLLMAYSQSPPPRSKVLLHSCCAPCSGAMVEEMHFNLSLDVTIFFYNPNIHPKREYEIRKDENKKYALKHGIPFVDCDYDAESWFKRMVGFELEPERGVRCSACFDMRMEVTAAYAVQHGFRYFTTTNATSRWKDEAQVNLAGIRAALLYHEAESPVIAASDSLPKVEFWVSNWKTDSMTRRKYEVSVQEKFYKQEYCGCSYSLRDSNIWRAQQGIPPVSIGGEAAGLGTRYFEDVALDEAEESQETVDAFFRDATAHFGDEVRLGRRQGKALGAAARAGDGLTGNTFSQRLKSTDSSSAALNNW